MRSCNALTDIIQCLSIIILAFFFDAFIFKDLNITYDWNIPIIDTLRDRVKIARKESGIFEVANRS